jgi:multiple sugar transport system permease protein
MQESVPLRPRSAIKWQSRRVLTFAALVAPVFIFRLVTAAYPIFNTIWLSLTNMTLLLPTSKFIGLQNYVKMTQDPAVRAGVGFTIGYVVISTALQLVLGLLVALMLNATFRGRGIGRAVNLIPWAIPTIVAAYTFRWFLDDQFGLLPEWIFQLTGVRPVIFISALGAQSAVILVNVWKNVPFMAIIFLAGLQGVPIDLYEAAKVDGANAWKRFWSITLPLVMPLVVTMTLFFVVWQLANFDLVYGLTSGGPGTATVTIALRIFQEGLMFFKFGYASAISVVLLVLVGLVGLAGMVLNRKVEVSL